MKSFISSRDYFLQPGYIFITYEDKIIYTVLGSCIMICLWDKIKKLAGCAHYIFPETNNKYQYTPKYGNVAINTLIKYFKKEGSLLYNIEAMIFGGSDIYENGVGKLNIKIARNILKRAKIKIVSEDVGGTLGRKIIYHTNTNQAVVYKVRKIRESDWWTYDKK